MNLSNSPESLESTTNSPFSLLLFLPLLAAIIAIAPFAIDTYLPAMTQIAEDLGTDMRMMQLSVSLFLGGYAAGLLFFGPLADIFGRRPIVLLGLSGFCLSSALLALSGSMTEFLLLRFIQAFIGAAATVPISGYVRAIYGKNMAKGLSYVGMIMMIAPMIAPTIGVLLLHLQGWQLIFTTLAGYALVIVLLAFFALPKVPCTPRNESVLTMFFRSYALVLGEKTVRRYILIVCSSTLVFFGYLTAIAFIYMTVFHVSESLFGILFAVNALVFLASSFLNTRLVGRLGSLKILKGGLMVAFSAALLLLVVNLLGLGLYWTVVALAFLLSGTLLVATNADAMILIEFPNNTGTAAGVIGTLRFGIGGLAGPLLALFYDGTILPFCFLVITAIIGIGCCLLFMPNQHSTTA